MASTGASSSSVPPLNNYYNDETPTASSSSSSSSETKTEYRSSTQYSFTPPPNSTSSKSSKKEEDRKDDSMYECNICLDIAKDAVVSMCGHLYCWPCLNQWLETRPNRQLCPVCKAAISKDKVIPLYGRNSDKQDPRSKVPPRPQGQRSEAPPDNSYTPFNFNGGSDNGFHLSFGIGAFPFGFFTYGNLRPSGTLGHGGVNGIPQFNEDQYLSKVFLWLAILFLIWLILA